MSDRKEITTSFDLGVVHVRRVMEVLWLLTLFLVPLMFATPSVINNGYDLPKVTLYRSLIGLLSALWVIEWGLILPGREGHLPRLSWARVRGLLLLQPTRWVAAAASLVLASSLISTLLSPSIPVSLWGSEPALDGSGFYNTLSHFVLFAVLSTHLKTSAQLWRLFAAIAISGVVVGFYGILQYYGLDPVGVHLGGARVVSSLGNSAVAAAFLLMVIPLTIALILRSRGTRVLSIGTAPWVALLAVPLLAIAFTQARGPVVGLVAALTVFLFLLAMAMGWRTAVHAGAVLAVSAALTWAVVTFITPRILMPETGSSGAFRVLSVLPEVTESFTSDKATIFHDAEIRLPVSTPSGMKARLLLWEGAGRLVLNRPWFKFDDRPPPLSLHLFGYGPEFFQYLFPLERPVDLVYSEGHKYYRFARDGHNDVVHRTVELGLFGLASHLLLLGAVAATGASLVLRGRTLSVPNQKLAMVALLASIGGRTIEQTVCGAVLDTARGGGCPARVIGPTASEVWGVRGNGGQRRVFNLGPRRRRESGFEPHLCGGPRIGRGGLYDYEEPLLRFGGKQGGHGRECAEARRPRHGYAAHRQGHRSSTGRGQVSRRPGEDTGYREKVHGGADRPVAPGSRFLFG